MLELLEKLHLSDKTNSMASTLSGGMKRKLCLAMAIIGGSEVQNVRRLIKFDLIINLYFFYIYEVSPK